jgi:hypothetical protein
LLRIKLIAIGLTILALALFLARVKWGFGTAGMQGV